MYCKVKHNCNTIFSIYDWQPMKHLMRVARSNTGRGQKYAMRNGSCTFSFLHT